MAKSLTTPYLAKLDQKNCLPPTFHWSNFVAQGVVKRLERDLTTISLDYALLKPHSPKPTGIGGQ